MEFLNELGGYITVLCDKCGQTIKMHKNYCKQYGDEYHFNPPISCSCGNTESVAYKIDESISGASTAGTVYGNVSNASTIYGMDRFNTPRGHGFAAERANHLYDKLTGKDTGIVGDDNVKFGADRIVDGVNIQSKYCNTGSKCIQECFQNGKFKYINADGSPMKIEVPSDKYDAAVQAMENRIKNGEVPGVTDSSEAKNIIRKGHFTYEQARNIAKVGTVESITFDAVNGAIIATTAFGVSTALTFATSIWNGDDFDVALKSATYSGLKVSGTTFISAVLSSQLSKAGLNSALVGSSEAIVRIMGPKASALLVNAFKSGKNIYGAAAMKSAAKMLRGNAITGAVSVVVLSSVDVVHIFRGRISGAQLFKNVANTASTVAGGTAGWVGGVAAGAAVGSIIPGAGTVVGGAVGLIGGLLGSFAGGSIASKASNAVLSNFIEDDADEMVRIIEKVFTQLAEDYLLSSREAENIIDNLKEDLTGSTLKDMFASYNRGEFAQTLLKTHIENEVKKRNKVSMPSEEEMQKGLRIVLEEMSDNMQRSEFVAINEEVDFESKQENYEIGEGDYDVFLFSPGKDKMAVSKVISEHNKIGIEESDKLVNIVPINILSGRTLEQAEEMAKALVKLGAQAKVKSSAETYHTVRSNNWGRIHLKERDLAGQRYQNRNFVYEGNKVSRNTKIAFVTKNDFDYAILAAITGKVIKVLVTEGNEINMNAPIAVIEV